MMIGAKELWNDLLNPYKIITTRERADCLNLFSMVDVSKRRGHKFKVVGRSLKGDLRCKVSFRSG